MYLARRTIDGRLHYFISRSFPEGGWWRSEDLLHLGVNPARLIVWTGRDTFHVREEVERKLRETDVHVRREEIERLFLPFVPRHVRDSYDRAWHQRHYRARRELPYAEQKRLEGQISLFDRRRLHYLKCGCLDLSRISTLPIRYFLPLADKSRDEIEQYFLAREIGLDPAEFKKYVYAALDLQRFFARREARTMPQYLDQDQLDEVFLEELCRINASDWFRMGEAVPGRLHPFLVRYLIMFFDYGWGPDTSWEEYIRRFMGSHRQYRPPVFQTDVSDQEADDLFGIGRDELRKLSRRGLLRLYRKRAQLFHPDKGGDHEKFIRLTQAYESLARECRLDEEPVER